MTVRHLPRLLNPEHWYVIDVDRSDGKRPPWQERLVSVHGPNSTVSAEWSLLGKHGFGYGFQIGRNGGESDLGLNLYAGRLASVWLRLRAPWTKWARVSEAADPKNWYYARHTGIRVHPHEGCLLAWEWDAYDGMWSRDTPWWRDWALRWADIAGRTKAETIDGETGATVVPLPEGTYPATWKRTEYVRRYVRFPGTLLDRINGPKRHHTVNIDIPGGIPVEGKGENSYDCGMDGLFGVNGATVEDAVANAVRSVLRDRSRYGGPHHLPHPMTVAEAADR